MQPKFIIIFVILGIGLLFIAFLLIENKETSQLTKLDTSRQELKPNAVGGILTAVSGIWGGIAGGIGKAVAKPAGTAELK